MNYLWKLWNDRIVWYTVADSPNAACGVIPTSVKGIRRLESVPMWTHWSEEQHRDFMVERMLDVS